MIFPKNLNKIDKESSSGKLTILLVDDHEMSARLEEDALKKIGGFNVKITTSIDGMKYILSHEKIDVVMFDYTFKNGRALHEIRIAKSRSRNTKVKFIVTSIQNHDDIKDHCYENNCDLFMVKPIQRSAMIQEIKKISKKDYRRAERAKCKITTKVTKDQNVYETIAIDISSDGAHLLDKEKKINPYVGLEVDLEFLLPNSLEIIKCIGTVVRFTEKGFGLKFEKINEENKNKIINYISKNNVNSQSTMYYL